MYNFRTIVNNYEDEGEIIIAGDFQAYPDVLYNENNRNNPKRNNISKHLTDFIELNELDFIDITNGSGPIYTYQHKMLPHSSYIDHIALFKNTSLKYDNCRIHSPSPLNMSDHLPISTSINYDYISLVNEINKITNESHIPHYAWKDSLFIKLYS